MFLSVKKKTPMNNVIYNYLSKVADIFFFVFEQETSQNIWVVEAKSSYWSILLPIE